MKQDDVQHSIVPVFSYQDFEEVLDKDKCSEDIKSVVFINCGGLMPWTEHWISDEASQINTYIFDAHRPYHHQNIHTSKGIFVVDDGEMPSLD